MSLRSMNSSRLDEKINVTDEDAFEMARVLTVREGIFCGISSGAAMWGALQEGDGVGSRCDCNPLARWWREICKHPSL